jgi:crossover junction endodeoxyribonuclease RuvC
MVILGVDPGTHYTGYAVVKTSAVRGKLIDYDIITLKNLSFPQKLKKIYDRLSEVIRKHRPDEFAIETAFYSKNVQSTLKLGHARGVCILAAANTSVPVSEYSPREIKKAVTGRGNASKEQVRYMISRILDIKPLQGRSDISDAIAVALCHYNKLVSGSVYRKNHNNWRNYLADNPQKVLYRN